MSERVTQRLRGRRKGETTRTCSLAYAFSTCIHVHVYTRARFARTCVRACVAYARVRTYARLQPDRGEKRKKGEAWDLFARISMAAAVAAPLPKNASRIRDLSRNMSYGGFPRGGVPLECSIVAFPSPHWKSTSASFKETTSKIRENIPKVFTFENFTWRILDLVTPWH